MTVRAVGVWMIALGVAQGCSEGANGMNTQDVAAGPLNSGGMMPTAPTQPSNVAGMGAPQQPMNPQPMNPEPMNPEPMNPEPMNPEPMNPEPMNPEPMNPEPMNPEPMNPTEGPQPQLPEISGECPEFRDGSTISVAGHGSISIWAGPAGMGGPLLFYWHGTGGSAAEATRTLPRSVREDITSSGGIIASFNGRNSSGADRDCSGTGAHNMADFLAADQIAACAVQNHGIDPRRIYSTGCSAGGLQTGCMAALRSSYIAAVAPNSGGTVGRRSLEDSSNVPALFTMHGGSGDNVIVNFGDTSRSLGQQFTSGGGFWIDCNHMVGHCRAPSELQVAAWEFLKAHPYGTDPSPYASGVPDSFPSYCEIP